MAEHAEEQKQEEPRSVAELTTEIVVAYVTRNTIARADLGDLIGAVARALWLLSVESRSPSQPNRSPPSRCAARFKTSTSTAWSAASSRETLRRHLDVAHQLTPEAYREQFGLKPDYPMAAPGYSATQRSEDAQAPGWA